MKQQQPSSPIAHLQQQRDALQVEYTQEKQQYTEQAEQVEIGRRLQQGICWYPLGGRSYYNAVNQLVIELERHAHREIEHSFEPGRAVSLFVANGVGHPSFFRFTSVVSYVQDDVMVVTSLRRQPSSRWQGEMTSACSSSSTRHPIVRCLPLSAR